MKLVRTEKEFCYNYQFYMEFDEDKVILENDRPDWSVMREIEAVVRAEPNIVWPEYELKKMKDKLVELTKHLPIKHLWYLESLEEIYAKNNKITINDFARQGYFIWSTDPTKLVF